MMCVIAGPDSTSPLRAQGSLRFPVARSSQHLGLQPLFWVRNSLP